MRSATSALRSRVSNLYMIVGGIAVAWSIPTSVSHQALSTISAIAVAGGVAVVFLALLIRKNVLWARDILLIVSGLMALLSLATLAGGLTLLWTLICIASLYLTWGLLKL